MKIKFLSLLATVLVISFTSCEHGHDDDTENPEIVLTTPSDQQQFGLTDTIDIVGHITDNHDLHELLVKLTRNEDGDTLLYFTPTVHALTEYHLDTFYVANETDHKHYTLQIIAWDHENNADSLSYVLHVE